MYTFTVGLVKFFSWLFNGKRTIKGYENLPQGNYILIAPHRTFWDPMWYAVSALPKRFIFMAKKELDVPLFGKFLQSVGAFFIDRQNPGPSTVKIPVKELKSGSRSLIMFPSGTRHSEELKTGVLLIARLSGVPLIPAVYQGPVKFFGLFKRNNTTISFGKEIIVPKEKMDEQQAETFLKQIQDTFDQLDHDIDPNWVYVDPKPKKETN